MAKILFKRLPQFIAAEVGYNRNACAEADCISQCDVHLSEFTCMLQRHSTHIPRLRIPLPFPVELRIRSDDRVIEFVVADDKCIVPFPSECSPPAAPMSASANSVPSFSIQSCCMRTDGRQDQPPGISGPRGRPLHVVGYSSVAVHSASPSDKQATSESTPSTRRWTQPYTKLSAERRRAIAQKQQSTE